MTFKKKVAKLLTSTRFWMLTLAAVTAIIDLKIQGTFGTISVLTIVKYWLAAIAGVGTLDSVAEKLAKR